MRIVLVCSWGKDESKIKYATRFLDNVVDGDGKVQVVLYGDLKNSYREYFKGRDVVYSEIKDPREVLDMFDYVITIGLGEDISGRNQIFSKKILISLGIP